MAQKIVESAALMRPIAAFSHAAKVRDRIFVGAVAGTDANRRLQGCDEHGIDFVTQAHRMFDNLETTLGLLGARMSDLVQAKTYVSDPRDAVSYRMVCTERFGSAFPAHATVGSWHFPLPQAALEIDAIAYLGDEDAVRIDMNDGRALPTGGSSGGLVRAGDHFVTVYPLDQHGDCAEGDPIAQCDVALQNLCDSLDAAGFARSDLCRIHVTLADPRFTQLFDAAFIERFAHPYPARTMVCAALEDERMLVQIEALSCRGGGRVIGVAPSSDGPTSPAVLVGDILYTSAMPGLRLGDAWQSTQAQSDAAWDRVEGLIGEAGLTPRSVVRTNNVLSHWKHFAAFNRAYDGRVDWPFPPRTTVLGMLQNPLGFVQVEAIAHRFADEAEIVQVPRDRRS